MLTPKQKLQILEKCFFFNEFVAGTRDRASFLEELERFSSNLRTDGFSDQDIDEIRDRVGRLIIIKGVPLKKERIVPGSQIARIQIGRVRVLNKTEQRNFLNEPWKLDPQSFVSEVRNYIFTSMNGRAFPIRPEFLRNPSSEWLDNLELSFLCSSLNLNNAAFLIDIRRRHCLFITKVAHESKIKIFGISFGGKIRLFDQMDGKIQTRPIDKIIQGEISMRGDIVVLSPDLERKWMTMGRKPPYPRSRFLADINYEINEEFVQRIGIIQYNASDCIPLSLYAAIQSQH